jgi:hypothetical protein
MVKTLASQAEAEQYLAAEGEAFVDLEGRTLRVGDGKTAGGAIVIRVIIAPNGALYGDLHNSEPMLPLCIPAP